MSMLRCGFAQVEITPEPGTVYLDGYGFRMQPSSGTRDPLYAKVCAFCTEKTRFVIIAMDICGLNRELSHRLRGWVRSAAGLADAEFVLCATHTHAGPACGVLDGLPINGLYWDEVGQKLGKAVKEAQANACAGHFRFAVGGGLEGGYNRRGKEIIDRRVPVCAFYDEQDVLRGVIASASCHAVCHLEFTCSADYPSVLTEAAAESFPGVPFLFLQGRGADIDPVVKGEEGIRLVGGSLTENVFGALKDMAGTEGWNGDSIKGAFCPTVVPMCVPSCEVMEQEAAVIAAQIYQEPDTQKRHYAGVELVWRQKMAMQTKKGIKPTVEADLQMAVIGGKWVLVFVPFEMLTPTGNAIEKMLIQQGYAPEKCFVVGYSNQNNGYLAPAAEGGMDGYETRGAAHWYGLPECSVHSEPAVLHAFSAMLNRLSGE